MLIPNQGHGLSPEDSAIQRRSGRTVGVSWAGARAARDGAVYQVLLNVTVPQRISIIVLFPGGTQTEVNE